MRPPQQLNLQAEYQDVNIKTSITITRRRERRTKDSEMKRHNIIIFGEAGCGKSSVVNMLVGEPLAKVSNGAGGCTFQNDSYEADIGGTHFHIFDTAGLDEGEEGRVPHSKAVQGLYTLIRKLDGVSLLVFCMRGRVKTNTRANWLLFNKVICSGKVPTIAVVTGLDSEANPDDWWRRDENKKVFKSYNIKPEGVSCVVSVRGHQMYRESQEKLRKLVQSSYLREPWGKEKEVWFSQICRDVYRTRICFIERRSKEFTAEMVTTLDGFAKEVNMNEKDVEQLKKDLLKAECKSRK